MHRFFVPVEWIEKQKVTMVGEMVHQIKNVLRMQAGRQIVVLDNSGYEYYVELTHVAKTVVVGQIYDSHPTPGEPELRISLYQGTLKSRKFEWILQKGTELGIAEFVPTICERSVLADVESVDQKTLRWERIIQEAAEQSGRGIMPELRPAMMFTQAAQRASQTSGYGLIGWEDEGEVSLKSLLMPLQKPPQVSLFIGSEGGFTVDEVRLAHGYNIAPFSLGQRILRAESAGLVAASALLYHFDELA